MAYTDPTIEFEEVTKDGKPVLVRVYLTIPEQDMHHHYYSVLPVKVVDMVSELVQMVGYKVVMLDPVSS